MPRNIPEQLEGRPNNEEFDYLDNQAAEPVQAEPKRFVRYNKYGDEILDWEILDCLWCLVFTAVYTNFFDNCKVIKKISLKFIKL